MGDIIERIQSRINDAPMPTEHLLDEAADEIKRLRAALKDIQAKSVGLNPPRHTWYFDRAEEALTGRRRMRRMDEWQPIETAPKTKEILIYCPAPTALLEPYWFIVTWSNGRWITWGGEPIAFEPTHWSPLTEPPNVHTVSISEASDQT